MWHSRCGGAGTHKTVRGFAPQAEPEEPRQFFADGGMVKPKKGFDMEAWTQQQEQQRAAGTQAALAAGKAAMDDAETQATSREGQKSPIGMTPDQAYRAGLITSPTPDWQYSCHSCASASAWHLSQQFA